jgi:hypothetical protein
MNIITHSIEKEIYGMVHTFKQKNPGKQKNLLFLDFDGVINGPGFHVGKTKSVLFDKMVMLYHTDAVKRLNQIANEFQTDIIISSSWRHIGLEYCRHYLYEAGIDETVPIIDTTGRDIPYHRWREIMNWLRLHPSFTNFVILDDLEMSVLSNYHVRTSFNTGLSEEKADEVRKLYLRGPIEL